MALFIDGGPATPIIRKAWVGARPAPSPDENTLGLYVASEIELSFFVGLFQFWESNFIHVLSQLVHSRTLRGFYTVTVNEQSELSAVLLTCR
jgi:hypothetical protein